MSSLRNMVKHPTISLVDSCSTFREIKQIHCQLLINGLLNDPLLHGLFVSKIALKQPNHLDYYNQVLDQCRNPTVFTFNSMIRAHSKSSSPDRSFHFYNRIIQSNDNLSPDKFTFTFLVRTCAQMPSCSSITGLTVHAAVVKYGFHTNPHVQSSLVYMYAQLGLLDSSRRVYLEISEPDLVSQTAMVTACVRSGKVEFARQVFDKMPYRDLTAWNAMIAGYSQCGQSREALHLFQLMQIECMEVNDVTMVSVLSACAQLGALDQGRWAHVYIERNKLQMTVNLGTAVIDMYFKCGNVDKAMEVFWKMKEKNVYTWSSALGGLAMSGAGKTCLELFGLMKQEGIKPNEVTFISVLRGCSVVGLVDEGREHFDSMRQTHGLEPELEHYGCMVDLYGRAGRLDDALNFISNMPMKPHAGAWGALLNACRIHRKRELGEFAWRKILELEALNHGAYVQLSNIYAESRNWDGVTNVRQLMKARGVKKLPGCSVIEVGGEIHEFFVGDKSHSKYGKIEAMWGEISRRLRLSGYVANTKPVLFDIEEEEKENALCMHSEKVAIAFGLISLSEGLPIRIVKNLRVCGDCHDVTKMISKVFNRKIIMRDRNRFHHFVDGECSCNGYW